MAMPMTKPGGTVEAFCADLRAAGLDAPWTRPGPLIALKASAVEARLWRWADIEPLVRRGPEFMAPGRGAERRVIRLDNPGVPERTATHTISAAVQYLLPGEVAPAHRHTPNAVRFMLRGEGAFTTVEGERCDMRPGDLVLTPSMTWHDHGNAGQGPVMWLDGLDSPVVRYLENLYMEPYPEERQADPKPATPGRYFFPWDAAHAALLRQAEAPPSPFDDVIWEYRAAVSGRSLLPSLGCYLQMLRPGVRTQAHRETSSALYRVVRGQGSTEIDSVRYDWGEGDFFAVPPRALHAHQNLGAAPAILFSFQDVPLLTALGLYRMDA